MSMYLFFISQQPYVPDEEDDDDDSDSDDTVLALTSVLNLTERNVSHTYSHIGPKSQREFKFSRCHY